MRSARLAAMAVVAAASMIGGAATATQAWAGPHPSTGAYGALFYGYGPSADIALTNAYAQESNYDCVAPREVSDQQIAPTNWQAIVKALCLPPGT